MQTPAFRPVEEMSYNEANAELDAIVRALESNQLELEESLRLYQRGVELLASLRQRLSQAEQRVSALMGEIDIESDERDVTLS